MSFKGKHFLILYFEECEHEIEFPVFVERKM